MDPVPIPWAREHRAPGLAGPSRQYAMGGWGVGEVWGGRGGQNNSPKGKCVVTPQKGGLGAGWAKLTDFPYSEVMNEQEITWTVTRPISEVVMSVNVAVGLPSPILWNMCPGSQSAGLETSISSCGP